MNMSSADDLNVEEQLSGLQGLPAELLNAVLRQLNASSRLRVFRTSKFLAKALLRIVPSIQRSSPPFQHFRALAPFLTEVLQDRQHPKLRLTLELVHHLFQQDTQHDSQRALLVARMLGAVPLCRAVDCLTIIWHNGLAFPWEPVFSAALAASFPSLTSLTFQGGRMSIGNLANVINHPLLSPRLLHLDPDLDIETNDITDITETSDITETTETTDITETSDITETTETTDITETSDIIETTETTDITETSDITETTETTDISDMDADITHQGQLDMSPFIGSRLQRLRLSGWVKVDKESESLSGLLPLPLHLSQLTVTGLKEWEGMEWKHDWDILAESVSSLTHLQQLRLYDQYRAYREHKEIGPGPMALLQALAHLPSLHTLLLEDYVVGQEQLTALLKLTQITHRSVWLLWPDLLMCQFRLQLEAAGNLALRLGLSRLPAPAQPHPPFAIATAGDGQWGTECRGAGCS
ncbi:hypothetical protein QJQ45_003748 [Haematococcus lacustris]|nr:hypothetical protein QJQ45_003748 [Haematococcus lacustris]